jgi:hypothetical protein
MEWFYEYERYDGCNVFLGDDLTTIIIGRGKLMLRLIDGRIITLLVLIHILVLAKNLIFVRKMDDAEKKTIFEKETCRIVQGVMMLLKGNRFGTMYKLQGRIISDGCNSSIVHDIGVEEEKTPIVSGEKVMLWH